MKTFLRITVTAISISFLIFISSVLSEAQVTFTNAAPITIADGTPTGPGVGNPYPSAINVSGQNGTVIDVNVRINGLTHAFPDDVALLLVSPSNQVLVIQSDVGGGTAVTNVSYTFDDQATAGIPNAGPLVAGTFRPSSVGDDEFFPLSGSPAPPVDCQPAGECPQSAPAGTSTLNGVFGGISPNGTWKLYAIDCCETDAGSIASGWSIIITTNAPPAVGDANLDMDGDGKTDLVVARPTANPLSEKPEAINGFLPGLSAGSFRERRLLWEKSASDLSALAPPVYWYTLPSGNSPAGFARFGDAASDFLTPEDFDGDGKDDLAVWRGGSPTVAAFYILQSSNNTVRIDQFGQTGDDPYIVGDYDGDNKADPAVFRCPNTAGQCYFFFRGSNLNPSGNVTYVPWGFGTSGDYYANPGDFDGDGKYDFCIQRDNPVSPGAAQFLLLKSNGLSYEFIDWGRSSDVIVPGDYDGDGKSDFCVSRVEIINSVTGMSFYILERDGGGTGAVPIRFGLSGDVRAPGDYDGDGKQDIAIWRANADPTQNFFWIRQSNGPVRVSEWGMQGDYPATNWYVH